MPIFPQVDMVPWGLNEMSVTYFDQNTTRIKQNSTLLILSKTLLLWLTSSLMHKFAFNPLGDWLMSDRSVQVNLPTTKNDKQINKQIYSLQRASVW